MDIINTFSTLNNSNIDLLCVISSFFSKIGLIKINEVIEVDVHLDFNKECFNILNNITI